MTNQRDEAARESQDAARDQQDDLSYEHDQDSEPTMAAPEEGRPDGLDALKDDSASGGDRPE
ncbi:MAG: hypothetical protein ACKOVB_13810 [Terrabacter sp.]